MKKKTMTERYGDEILSDNSKDTPCEQCKNCIFNNNGDIWSNVYTKSSCMIYKYPDYKPTEIINNTGICKHMMEKRHG